MVIECTLLFQDTMIVGYDAYHDSSQKGTSVGAVVATTNAEYTDYTSFVSFHKNREELSNNFKMAITSQCSEIL